MLDLGANVDCTAEHLLQFAVMVGFGVCAQKCGAPSVGLLNIGEELIKGSEVIKRAGELLRAAGDAGNLNFYGNVEGNDTFKGGGHRGLRRLCQECRAQDDGRRGVDDLGYLEGRVQAQYLHQNGCHHCLSGVICADEARSPPLQRRRIAGPARPSL